MIVDWIVDWIEAARGIHPDWDSPLSELLPDQPSVGGRYLKGLSLRVGSGARGDGHGSFGHDK